MRLDKYVEFVRELTRLSGDVIRPYYANLDVGHELKADESPVTVADRRAEQVMRQRIKEQFPEHGVVGEEYGTERGDAEFVWVLDPIDGTKSFITGVPLFTTLIGLLHRGRPVLGCIHQPILGQTIIGDGLTTELNGTVTRVRSIPTLSQATLLTTDPLLPGRHQNGAAFAAVSQSTRLFRTFGDGYGYLLLASGWADVMVDPIMNPWDLLPLIPVVEGAGGKITDWQGRRADEPGANSCVAAAPHLHAEVIAALNR
jgi:myo-inositol-1(or 4)-monophosphatase